MPEEAPVTRMFACSSFTCSRSADSCSAHEKMPFDIVEASALARVPNTSARTACNALVVGRGLRRELGEVAREPEITPAASSRARSASLSAPPASAASSCASSAAGAGFRCDGSPSYQPP